MNLFFLCFLFNVASSMWPPVMSFMGNTSDEKLDTLEDSEKSENPPQIESNEEEGSGEVVTEQAVSVEANKETNVTTEADQAEVTETVVLDPKDGEPESQMALEDSQGNSVQQPGDTSSLEPDEKPELAAVSQESQLEPPKSEDAGSEAEEPMPEEDAGTNEVSVGNSDAVFSPVVADTDETKNEQESQSENLEKRTSSVNVEVSPDTDNLNRVEPSDAQLSLSTESAGSANESSVLKRSPSDEISERVVDFVSRELDSRLDGSELIDSQRSSSATNASDSVDVVMELEKTKKEMKMLENALQGAARQAQAKADEIAKLMHENEQLKSATEDLKRKSNEAEVESLREEYHQRVATLERKVYALTKERDTLRREHNKKSDAAALLKEKDEIINQVMAEGEELSKKQAAQEGQIRKLRAQIREVEEEKKGLITKLQSEENKVESIKRDKTATEKLLQETIEKHQAELASQKEYYSNALAAAKEAQALAEERTNNEARIELENRLKEAGERESMLVQALEELRQTLSKKEQQVWSSLVVSTCLGGAFIGSLFSGLVADGVGRRRAFQLSALPMIIGASVSATTESLEGMLLGRFFVGIGMGIGPSVTALYVTEVSPAYVRGTYGSSTQIATCLGLLASLFAGIPAKDNFGWWRICFWISTVPAVVLAVFMELCAESPQWLFKRGRAAEAEVVFEKLLGGAYVKAAMAELVKSDRGDDADSAKLSELLFGRSFRVVFIGSTLFALQQLSGINAVFYFSSTVFKKAGVPSASANICVGVCNLLGSTVAVVLMDKLGRKVLLIGSFAGMAVSLGLQALAHTSYSSTFGTLFLSVGGMLLFVLSFATGAGPVPSILLSEICPGRLRATALAVCLAVHWVINFFVGLLFLRMLEQLGSVLLNAIFGFFCVVAVIFVQKNVIETKGKSLQEIEISLLSATSHFYPSHVVVPLLYSLFANTPSNHVSAVCLSSLHLVSSGIF
ncbi:hypothetical protein F2Q70_00044310, partial [Brassica cretica]